jgi:hypothetical protein
MQSAKTKFISSRIRASAVALEDLLPCIMVATKAAENASGAGLIAPQQGRPALHAGAEWRPFATLGSSRARCGSKRSIGSVTGE